MYLATCAQHPTESPNKCSEATQMLGRSCSAGGPNFLAHHYKKPIFVSKGRGWVGLLLIMLVDWKQN